MFQVAAEPIQAPADDHVDAAAFQVAGEAIQRGARVARGGRENVERAKKGSAGDRPPNVPGAYREWVKRQYGGVDLLGLQLTGAGSRPSVRSTVPQMTIPPPATRTGLAKGAANLDVHSLSREPKSGTLLALFRLASQSLYISGAPSLLTAAGALSRGAGVRLSGLIVAALETGCRLGELLALIWADVDINRRELTIRAENAKDGDVRPVPISTRLAAVLEMAGTDPAGRPYSPTAFVFGVAGEPITTIKKAWTTCVLRAHGHEPEWVKGGGLSELSREALRAIDLHFHDLRHEAGSRWHEAGMPLSHIKEILGHANISQTDTYSNAGRVAVQDSMRRFDDLRGKPVAKDETVEHRPLGHENDGPSTKDLLH